MVALGQQVTDPTGIWLTEFWNRSVKKVWSTDGSARRARADADARPRAPRRHARAVAGDRFRARLQRRRAAGAGREPGAGTTILYRLDGAR